MSPSPLCGESVPSFKYLQFTAEWHQFMACRADLMPWRHRLPQGVSWEYPESLLRPSWELLESLFEYLCWFFDKIWPKSHFFQNGHILKFQECHFSRKKSPCGRLPNTEGLFRSPHRGTFQKLPPQNKFIFLITWKSDFFQKIEILMEIYRSKSKFHWEPEWSVWSIWTYSTGWIFIFRTQKVSFWRTLKI